MKYHLWKVYNLSGMSLKERGPVEMRNTGNSRISFYFARVLGRPARVKSSSKRREVQHWWSLSRISENQNPEPSNSQSNTLATSPYCWYLYWKSSFLQLQVPESPIWQGLSCWSRDWYYYKQNKTKFPRSDSLWCALKPPPFNFNGFGLFATYQDIFLRDRNSEVMPHMDADVRRTKSRRCDNSQLNGMGWNGGFQVIVPVSRQRRKGG